MQVLTIGLLSTSIVEIYCSNCVDHKHIKMAGNYEFTKCKYHADVCSQLAGHSPSHL